MKRTVLCLLVLLLLCLSGCAAGEGKETKEQETTASIPETEATIMKEQNGVRYFTVSDAVRKNTDIRVTLLPEGTQGEAGIFFGYEDEESLFGYKGYLVAVKNGSVHINFVSSSIRSLASAKTDAMKKGEEMTLSVKLRGDSCAVRLLREGKEDEWPLVDTKINSSTDFVIGCADFGADPVTFGDLTVAYPASDGTAFYVNPVKNDLADPDVFYEDGIFYLYGTGGAGYSVFTSEDLVSWKDGGVCAQPGLWGTTRWYWAPDIEKIGDKYYMVCSCDENIGIAVSDSPLGPFRELTDKVLYPHSIDGHLFVDDDGSIYLFFVSWDNREYGIYGVKLNADLKPVTAPKLLIKPTETWEMQSGGVAEGPYMLKHNGTYYLTYSGSNYIDPKYAVGYATSTAPLGSYTKYVKNPIMIGTAQVNGTGHHCFVTLPDGQILIVYHCHKSLTEVHDRRICIDRARFIEGKDGMDILQVYGPTVTPQPYPLPKSK